MFLEVKCAIGARTDLGRPTTSAKENKEAFMRGLSFRAKWHCDVDLIGRCVRCFGIDGVKPLA